MSVVTIMAAALFRELHGRGVVALGQGDCEAIIAAVIARTAEAANNSMTAQQARKPGKPA